MRLLYAIGLLFVLGALSAAVGVNPLALELTDHVSFLEAIYTLGGFIAFLYAFRWTRRAERDRYSLVVAGLNGGRLLAVRINLTIGWVMMAKNGLYVVIGMAAMTAMPSGGTPTVQASVLGICFLLGQCLSVFLMVRINHLYDLLINYYERLAHGEPDQITREEMSW